MINNSKKLSNNECYKLKRFLFKNPLFKNIDATYIIHLENNGRLPSIEKQLSLYHPSNIVYILFNKGFKKCIKNNNIDKAPLDLIDSFFYIFKDAKNKNYKNILILEDDFIFDEKINNELNISKNIDIFLNSNKNKIFIYYLGCIPYLQVNSVTTSNLLLLSTGTHSCIYSKKFIDYILTVSQESIIDWDVYLNFNYSRYVYYKPLCYQIFPDTENLKHWDRNNIYLKYIVKFQMFVKKLLRLDLQIEPGFTIMYIVSKLLFWLIIIIILYILYKIYLLLMFNLQNVSK
jgi:hypothetical protein